MTHWYTRTTDSYVTWQVKELGSAQLAIARLQRQVVAVTLQKDELKEELSHFRKMKLASLLSHRTPST